MRIIDTQKRIFSICLAIFLMFSPCFVAHAEENLDKKTDIEAQMGHAKSEIKKLKLLEKIETNKLYKNQQKLEYNQHNLIKNKKK